jgi:hypothetical protein
MKPISVAFLLFVSTLARCSSGLPQRKISQFPSFLWPVKENLILKTVGMYSVLCKCGQLYIGQAGHLIETRVKKHHWYIIL